MKIADIMNVNVSRIRVGSTVRQAAELLSTSQASDLMVVDAANNFAGVLSEGDLIRVTLPDFEEILASGEGLSAGLDVFIEKGNKLASRAIDEYVIKSPITVRPQDPVLRAATIMITKMIRRLPVVDDGQLVGVISRADICKGVINA